MKWIFIPRNVILGNNFLEYDILNVFGIQIQFPGIFDKFPKIPLMEAAESGQPAMMDGGGGRWLWIVIWVFWSFIMGNIFLRRGVVIFFNDFPSRECCVKLPTKHGIVFIFSGKKNLPPCQMPPKGQVSYLNQLWNRVEFNVEQTWWRWGPS